jgi:hypothetical protein
VHRHRWDTATRARRRVEDPCQRSTWTWPSWRCCSESGTCQKLLLRSLVRSFVDSWRGKKKNQGVIKITNESMGRNKINQQCSRGTWTSVLERDENSKPAGKNVY